MVNIGIIIILTGQPCRDTDGFVEAIAIAVIREESQRAGISISSVRGPRCWPHIVATRILIARRLRNLDWSLSRIGRALNRDHSTVVHYLKGAV